MMKRQFTSDNETKKMIKDKERIVIIKGLNYL